MIIALEGQQKNFFFCILISFMMGCNIAFFLIYMYLFKVSSLCKFISLSVYLSFNFKLIAM